MKKLLLMISGALLLVQSQAYAQREKCGMQHLHHLMIEKDPSWADKLQAERASLQSAANYYKQYKADGRNERTTATISAVPIIFHIVVDSAQFLGLGGIAGIKRRCDSQIAVLNADYNRSNSDSIKIPSGWKSLYGNVGIHFGLAHVDPNGNCSPGYEIKITAATGFSNKDQAFPEAKIATTGLAAWDNTKYYNVWCINYIDAAEGLLGITVPKSEAPFYPANNEGVCILYTTLGSTGPTGSATGMGEFLNPYNLGRTLTHETGHFFEIWHPWGDDGGQCPTWSSTATITGSGLSSADDDYGITCTSGTGYDDGLDDTPPESDAVYGNPSYTISGGTTNDCCKMHGSTDTQPIGIACLSYMDYTDDNAMHLFTVDQAAVMASMALIPAGSAGTTAGEGIIGENYSLTQHPELLVACTSTAIATVETNNEVNVFPNPTTGEVTITMNTANDKVNQIVVINLLGQEVMSVNGQQKDFYMLNLAGMSKGVYFIKCNFASGNSVTRRMLLQ